MKKINITEKKLIVYTSLLVAVLLNIFKLISLRENAIIPHLWKFNLYEWLFQFAWNFLFCLVVAYVSVTTEKKQFTSPTYKILQLLILYLIIFAVAQVAGVNIQVKVFDDNEPLKIFRALYFGRLFASFTLIIILIQLFRLLGEKKLKEQENEQLRNAYLSAQLQILKEQLNPHFFFNTLSSLSAVVREDPKKAQQYIAHLSKIFHYSLDAKDRSIVTVKDELSALDSYIQLVKMRFENNVVINISIDQKMMYYFLPHMSLQPLIENAIKHNIVSSAKNLEINICTDDNRIKITNNLQPFKMSEVSTGIGLANLNERYKILMKQEISIEIDDATFAVTLPVKENI